MLRTQLLGIIDKNKCDITNFVSRNLFEDAFQRVCS